jgi:rhodanese-related sulfurtransferase
MPVGVKELLCVADAAVPRLGYEEAEVLVAGGALVVDVREAAELQETGKIKGAVNVSRGMLEFKADPALPSHHPDFVRDETVCVYCSSGNRAALAGRTLQEMGYTDVRNIGAFKDWVAAGGPVEKV